MVGLSKAFLAHIGTNILCSKRHAFPSPVYTHTQQIQQRSWMESFSVLAQKSLLQNLSIHLRKTSTFQSLLRILAERFIPSVLNHQNRTLQDSGKAPTPDSMKNTAAAVQDFNSTPPSYYYVCTFAYLFCISSHSTPHVQIPSFKRRVNRKSLQIKMPQHLI